jgi:hypothetical protein
MGQANEATTFCKLVSARGLHEACPEAGCPFWEADVVEGRCVVEQLDLSGREDVAVWLVQIRDQLAAARSSEEQDEARRRLYSLLDTGDADGG